MDNHHQHPMKMYFIFFNIKKWLFFGGAFWTRGERERAISE